MDLNCDKGTESAQGLSGILRTKSAHWERDFYHTETKSEESFIKSFEIFEKNHIGRGKIFLRGGNEIN